MVLVHTVSSKCHQNCLVINSLWNIFFLHSERNSYGFGTMGCKWWQNYPFNVSMYWLIAFLYFKDNVLILLSFIFQESLDSTEKLLKPVPVILMVKRCCNLFFFYCLLVYLCWNYYNIINITYNMYLFIPLKLFVLLCLSNWSFKKQMNYSNYNFIIVIAVQ